MKTIQFSPDASGAMKIAFGEETPSRPSQQVTVPWFDKDNPGWLCQVQISHEYIFIKKPGCPTVGIHLDDLIRLVRVAEPALMPKPPETKTETPQPSPQ